MLLAAEQGHSATVNSLIRAGAQLNIQNNVRYEIRIFLCIDCPFAGWVHTDNVGCEKWTWECDQKFVTC